MNICFIAATYHPVIGGGETYVKTLAEGLVKSGDNVFVITDQFMGSPTHELLNGVSIYRCSEYCEMLNRSDKIKWEQMYFSILIDIVMHLGNKSIDIVHANSFETSIIGSYVSKELNVPLICTYHEVSPEDEAFGIGKCRVVFQNSNVDAFISSSKFYYDKALNFGSQKEKLNLIYHGIDTNKFGGNVNNLKYKNENEFMVLCAARIKERKGIRELIEATHLIKNKIFNLKVVVCGTVNSASEDYYHNILLLVDSLKLTGNIDIHTNISHDEMADVYKESDIVIQPSYYEGLGLAILEGMASGKPIIACDTVGINEIITSGVTGLLIEPRDASSIAEAVIQLKNDEKLSQKISSAGYKMVKDRFSIERVISETKQLYQKCQTERMVSHDSKKS